MRAKANIDPKKTESQYQSYSNMHLTQKQKKNAKSIGAIGRTKKTRDIKNQSNFEPSLNADLFQIENETSNPNDQDFRSVENAEQESMVSQNNERLRNKRKVQGPTLKRFKQFQNNFKSNGSNTRKDGSVGSELQLNMDTKMSKQASNKTSMSDRKDELLRGVGMDKKSVNTSDQGTPRRGMGKSHSTKLMQLRSKHRDLGHGSKLSSRGEDNEAFRTPGPMTSNGKLQDALSPQQRQEAQLDRFQNKWNKNQQSVAAKTINITVLNKSSELRNVIKQNYQKLASKRKIQRTQRSGAENSVITAPNQSVSLQINPETGQFTFRKFDGVSGDQAKWVESPEIAPEEQKIEQKQKTKKIEMDEENSDSIQISRQNSSLRSVERSPQIGGRKPKMNENSQDEILIQDQSARRSKKQRNTQKQKNALSPTSSVNVDRGFKKPPLIPAAEGSQVSSQFEIDIKLTAAQKQEFESINSPQLPSNLENSSQDSVSASPLEMAKIQENTKQNSQDNNSRIAESERRANESEKSSQVHQEYKQCPQNKFSKFLSKRKDASRSSRQQADTISSRQQSVVDEEVKIVISGSGQIAEYRQRVSDSENSQDFRIIKNQHANSAQDRVNHDGEFSKRAEAADHEIQIPITNGQFENHDGSTQIQTSARKQGHKSNQPKQASIQKKNPSLKQSERNQQQLGLPIQAQGIVAEFPNEARQARPVMVPLLRIQGLHKAQNAEQRFVKKVSPPATKLTFCIDDPEQQQRGNSYERQQSNSKGSTRKKWLTKRGAEVLEQKVNVFDFGRTSRTAGSDLNSLEARQAIQSAHVPTHQLIETTSKHLRKQLSSPQLFNTDFLLSILAPMTKTQLNDVLEETPDIYIHSFTALMIQLLKQMDNVEQHNQSRILLKEISFILLNIVKYDHQNFILFNQLHILNQAKDLNIVDQLIQLGIQFQSDQIEAQIWNSIVQILLGIGALRVVITQALIQNIQDNLPSPSGYALLSIKQLLGPANKYMNKACNREHLMRILEQMEYNQNIKNEIAKQLIQFKNTSAQDHDIGAKRTSVPLRPSLLSNNSSSKQMNQIIDDFGSFIENKTKTNVYRDMQFSIGSEIQKTMESEDTARNHTLEDQITCKYNTTLQKTANSEIAQNNTEIPEKHFYDHISNIQTQFAQIEAKLDSQKQQIKHQQQNSMIKDVTASSIGGSQISSVVQELTPSHRSMFKSFENKQEISRHGKSLEDIVEHTDFSKRNTENKQKNNRYNQGQTNSEEDHQSILQHLEQFQPQLDFDADEESGFTMTKFEERTQNTKSKVPVEKPTAASKMRKEASFEKMQETSTRMNARMKIAKLDLERIMTEESSSNGGDELVLHVDESRRLHEAARPIPKGMKQLHIKKAVDYNNAQLLSKDRDPHFDDNNLEENEFDEMDSIAGLSDTNESGVSSLQESQRSDINDNGPSQSCQVANLLPTPVQTASTKNNVYFVETKKVSVGTIRRNIMETQVQIENLQEEVNNSGMAKKGKRALFH